MKEIKMITINKIKKCLLKIFEEEDDGQPNSKIIRANWGAITRLLKPYQFTQEEEQELLRVVNWTNDNCVGALEDLGWKVLRVMGDGKDN